MPLPQKLLDKMRAQETITAKHGDLAPGGRRIDIKDQHPLSYKTVVIMSNVAAVTATATENSTAGCSLVLPEIQ
jgi:hypothetical protein